jgi:hypothetical protein
MGVGEVERSGQDRRSGLDRRGAPRGVERRQGDRRAGFVAGAVMAAATAMPSGAQADVYTRRNAQGVLEATNQEGADGYKLAFRSKGIVKHSASFKPGRPAPAWLEDLIQEAAARERVDPALVRSVIRVESAFDQQAVSTAGARGLMQLMPDTAARFGVRDSFDARQNVSGGTRYLAVLLRMFRGDVPLAVAAYNAGEGAVKRHGGIPPYRETKDYVRKVQALLGAPVTTTADAPAGMMSFTPGSEGRTSAPVQVASKAPAGRSTLYKWRDARGVTHLGGTPPAGVDYEVVRNSD